VLSVKRTDDDDDGVFCSATETVKVSAGKHLAVMIAKGVDKFPDNSERMSGTIDIWWIVRIL